MPNLHVNSAVKSRNTFRMQPTTITTLDFGHIQPSQYFSLVPGDKFDVDISAFSRLSPMAVPTYGRANLVTSAFFVPSYVIDDQFEDFVGGQHEGVNQVIMPILLSHATIMQIFMDSEFSVSGTTSDFDFLTFSFPNPSSTEPVVSNRRKFTGFGRYMYKIFRNLGYTLPLRFISDPVPTSSEYYPDSKVCFSAIPLLSFLKAYLDFLSFAPTASVSKLSSYLDQVRRHISVGSIADPTYQKYGYNGFILLGSSLASALKSVRLLYDQSYITSAWNSPSAPVVPSDTSSVGVSYPTINNSFDQKNVTTGGVGAGKSFPLSSDNNSVPITQQALDFLKRFDDWVRRNSYSGSRSVQRIYSRFGIKPDDYRSRYSQYLGSFSSPVQIGDVTSTSTSAFQTDVSLAGKQTIEPLGSYAGKGIISNDGHFSYNASDYGILIFISFISVSPYYYQGIRRDVLRVNALDYYNPEFDGLGGQPIYYGEVYNRSDLFDVKELSDVISVPSITSVFGYTERYNDYRYTPDIISGDFNVFESSTPWHLGRRLFDDVASKRQIASSDNVVYYPNRFYVGGSTYYSGPKSQYDRIFSVGTDSSVDHFYLHMRFDVKASRPMMSHSETARLGLGSLSIPKGGVQIS
ncbi:major capsid protein [Dipodfec virus UOA04_Rod_567]|nr:major capsid protein [Dipodfec virus UOA04_Rod_567]